MTDSQSTTTDTYEPNSARDRSTREESLRMAGWDIDPQTGFWTHPHAGGLRNFASAERTVDRWIAEGGIG